MFAFYMRLVEFLRYFNVGKDIQSSRRSYWVLQLFGEMWLFFEGKSCSLKDMICLQLVVEAQI